MKLVIHYHLWLRHMRHAAGAHHLVQFHLFRDLFVLWANAQSMGTMERSALKAHLWSGTRCQCNSLQPALEHVCSLAFRVFTRTEEPPPWCTFPTPRMLVIGTAPASHLDVIWTPNSLLLRHLLSRLCSSANISQTLLTSSLQENDFWSNWLLLHSWFPWFYLTGDVTYFLPLVA